MGSMRRRMSLRWGVLLGIAACASGESSEGTVAGSGPRDPATVAASPPLAGFGADVPAGRVFSGTHAADSARATATAPLADTSGTPRLGARGSAARASAATPPPVTPTPAGALGTNTTASGGNAGAGTAPSKSGVTLAAGEISAASGVFTAVQADRGAEVYETSCARCHMASAHTGGTFASTWNSRRVSDLYTFLYNSMPLDDPGSLTDEQYADVVAYMLQLNGHPAGRSALKPDTVALRKLRIDIRRSASR